MILTQTQTLVVRMPKCGSIWLEGVIGLNEIPYKQAARTTRYRFGPRHVPPWAVSTPFKKALALVRHPVSWYESWWRYQMHMNWPAMDAGAPPGSKDSHPQWPLVGLGADDFNVFARKVLEQEPAYVTRLYEWFAGAKQAPHVDFVARLEHAEADVQRIFSELGYGAISCPPPRHVSPPRPITWDAGLRREIEAVEHPAIRRFYPETL